MCSSRTVHKNAEGKDVQIFYIFQQSQICGRLAGLGELLQLYKAYQHKNGPNKVSVGDEKRLCQLLYGVDKKQLASFKFRLSDIVRISQEKKVFKKGYKAGWSEEIFTVAVRYPMEPPTYAIKDDDGETIEGKFYTQELQKVRRHDSFPAKDGDVYVVEKIIKTRQRKGKKQYLVRWHGYSPEHDSWVDSIIT